MDGLPVAVLIAVPVIAAFVVFVLLPRLQRHEDQRKRGSRRARR